jgi:RNA polymerase sigma-70 factor (ECF subfamily)
MRGTDKHRMQETESQLIERTRGGDGGAFRLLFEKYQPILFRSVAYTLQDVDTAHDVVQETFVRVWNHRSSLQPHLPLLGYLFRISRNLVLDHLKHEAVQKKLEAKIAPAMYGSADDPVDSLHASMLEEKVAEVIRTKLPPKCREVFLLSRVEEMPNPEISRQLGISVKTVENQITRGLRILRRHLRRYL